MESPTAKVSRRDAPFRTGRGVTNPRRTDASRPSHQRSTCGRRESRPPGQARPPVPARSEGRAARPKCGSAPRAATPRPPTLDGPNPALVRPASGVTMRRRIDEAWYSEEAPDPPRRQGDGPHVDFKPLTSQL